MALREGMNQQTSFAESEYARKKKTTRREKFLAQMEEVVPWARQVEVIVRTTRRANRDARRWHRHPRR